ncbi:DUF6182 family protein [Spirillospora sp. CA-294931]|uniref:DUF6182 family protein n=1 Tax=Spirillospora sp. CA-294931 TaxID=3240042 RepID=UPI003D924C99
MRFSQDVLRAHFEARVARAGSRPAGDYGAVAVLRDFDPATFAGAAAGFARATAGDRRAAWYGAFTRTIFLAGDPANLAERFPRRHLSPGGSVAWYGPGPLADLRTLRRLLRPFRGPLGVPVPFAHEIDLPGGGHGRAVLSVLGAGMAVEDYLVDVNHLVAEAEFDGLLDGVGRLLVRHLPDATDPPARPDRLRVTADLGQFRARAYLSVG